MKNRLLGVFAVCTLAVVSQLNAAMVNGGFETGDFTGWVNDGYEPFGVSSAASHSGGFAAYTSGFGGGGLPPSSSLSQTFDTIAGATYRVSFWLNQEAAWLHDLPDAPDFGSSSLSVGWNGDSVLSQTWQGRAEDFTAPYTTSWSGWTEYIFKATATGNSTELRFTGYSPEGSCDQYLDDITVVLDPTTIAPVPEPSTIIAGALLLVPLGLQGVRVLRKGRRRIG